MHPALEKGSGKKLHGHTQITHLATALRPMNEYHKNILYFRNEVACVSFLYR